MSSAIDFYYLEERALDLLADRVACRDAVESTNEREYAACTADIANWLDLAWQDLRDAKGTAADELRSLLFSFFPEDITNNDVERLRDAIRRLAVAYATAHELTQQGVSRRDRKTGKEGGDASGRSRSIQAEIDHEDWINEARLILAKWNKTLPRPSRMHLAKRVKDSLGAKQTPDRISRVLKRAGL